jgi:hypothetical protein
LAEAGFLREIVIERLVQGIPSMSLPTRGMKRWSAFVLCGSISDVSDVVGAFGGGEALEEWGARLLSL